MEVFYIVLAVILLGIMMVGVFVLGALFAVNLLADARDSACYDRLREEYYQLAKFKSLNDPRPYVPPQSAVIPRSKTPRNSIAKGMDALERRLKEGRRGVYMWRAGDREKAD